MYEAFQGEKVFRLFFFICSQNKPIKPTEDFLVSKTNKQTKTNNLSVEEENIMPFYKPMHYVIISQYKEKKKGSFSRESLRKTCRKSEFLWLWAVDILQRKK